MTVPTTASPKTRPLWKVSLYILVGFFALLGVVSLFRAPASAPVVAANVVSPPVAAAPAPTPPAAAPVEDKQPANSSGDLDYLTLKAASEKQLKLKLTDDHGLRYQNVETRLSTLDGTGIVSFCGEVNSNTPLGGYGGFKRFIASQSTAITEDGMTPDDFEQAWGQFCSGGVKVPTVWF